MSSNLWFRISSSLKNIIGKDLITDDFIAVFELVKNSFDAHAKRVDIIFEKDKIIIQDDGKGMTLDDVESRWLFVAYSAKKEGLEDKELLDQEQFSDYRNQIESKKYFAGAKGIGRFSCDRLGENLILSTRKVHSPVTEQIQINWKSFEQNSSLEFVKVPVVHDTIANEFNHGTRLEISNLHAPWGRSKLQSLKYSLEKLINPFSDYSAGELDAFEIYVHCERELEEDKSEGLERNKVNGPVRNFIFETLNLKTTQIRTEITKENIISELIDRGTLIYKVREKNKDYTLLDDFTIHLFYLNQAAKYNFTRQMGVRAKGFGSVFLFKNGFRVYPFGDEEDDSLGIDFRHQQGYARTLATRDLLGRITINTDNDEEFRETSSRDGGLVKTDGYAQLREAFLEKGLKRLEKYVVDVQWGEPFRKKGWDDFKEALREDKEKEDISVIESNMGSRALLGEIIRKMADDKDLEILDYNKDLINIVYDKLDSIKPEVFDNLIKIAEKTDDASFGSEISSLKNRYEKLLREAEESRIRAIEAEKQRLEAEEKERKAEEARKIEESRRRKAEEGERIANIQAKEKELQRREEEIRRKEAEQRAEEHQAARLKAESTLKVAQDKNTYLDATRKTLSEDAEDLIHSIKVSAIGIDASLEALIQKIKSGLKDDATLLEDISRIKFITDKVLKLSKLITKSNFKADQEVKKVNVAQYIQEYIGTYSYAYKDKVNIEFVGSSDFVTRLSILDLSIVLDNLVSNSYKASADAILVEAFELENKLEVLFHDNGNGICSEFLRNTDAMFELGAKSDVEGSGIGLFSARKKMIEMYGNLEFVGNGVKLKGATFKLVFN